MKKLKFFWLSGLLAFISPCFSQYHNNDDDLRDFFSAVLYVSGETLPTTIINGEEYEILYKKPWTKQIREFKTPATGTAFFLVRGLDMYLVTAEHVARFLEPSSKVKYRNVDGHKKELNIDELTLAKDDLKILNWVRHPTADVAVLHLGILDETIDDITTFNYSYLEDSVKAPNRFNDLTLIGYPLGLGINPLSISPITRNTRSASDVVYFKRFDNGILNPFIITDDPSIGGFSGGPVLEVHLSEQALNFHGMKSRIAPTVVGLVHGNLSAKDPGSFAAIVPSFQILEALELAAKYNGEYTFYYPNGNIWSKRVYKDGLPWTVLSNFDCNGKPQDMGDLKDGEGQLYVWSEASTYYEVIRCSKGKCLGGVFGYPMKNQPANVNSKTN